MDPLKDLTQQWPSWHKIKREILSRSLNAIALLTFIVLIGCGPMVRINPSFTKGPPNYLALLPADYSVDIPRERIDIVRSALISELRHRNFVIADDKIVRENCSKPACPEKERLASKYGIGGFITLKIASFSKNSFLAGYYNELSGTFFLNDPFDREILSISHTTSEKGGLIFNSGQLIQGIISQINNQGDNPFEDLATEFARMLVDELPPPAESTSASSELFNLNLTSVTAVWQKPHYYIVCAEGTPDAVATILLGNQRTSFRELSQGTYCYGFSALVSSGQPVQGIVELRGAFGNSVRKDFSLPISAPCNLENRIQLDQNSFTLLCTLLSGDVINSKQGCSDKIQLCTAEKLIIFQALSQNGPYEKIAESWASPTLLPARSDPLAVMSVGSGGATSLPVTISRPKIAN